MESMALESALERMNTSICNTGMSSCEKHRYPLVRVAAGQEVAFEHEPVPYWVPFHVQPLMPPHVKASHLRCDRAGVWCRGKGKIQSGRRDGAGMRRRRTG